MKKIAVNLGQRSYDILVGYKIIEGLGPYLQKLAIGQDAVIISNPTIHHLHGGHLQSILSRRGFSTRFYLVADSERSKSEKVCFDLVNKIAAYDVKKRIFIVAFGGGVIGDLVGFIASVYKRGIPYIQIPTTFLAQVDSAIGGKTGIDLAVGKNLIGSFYQPRMVMSDLSFLRTLSLKQIKNGLAEVIKYGIIKDAQLFGYVEKNYKNILNLNIECLRHIVCACSRIKAKIVEQDEMDSSSKRAILNLGHTIGHAIEAAACFKEYTHGEAVAIGIVCACGISVKLGLMDASSAKRVENLLTKVGLPTSCINLKMADILHAQSHDKKFIHGKNRFVLPRRIGSVTIKEGIPANLIENVLKRRVK
jgi:3-dehydroquinate synthase